jgi:hypothetical protein
MMPKSGDCGALVEKEAEMKTKVFMMAVVASLVFQPWLSSRVKELHITLKWNPNQKQLLPALDVTGGVYALAVAPLVDKRDRGTEIGENTEQKVAVPVYTASDVPAFVRDHLIARIKAIGLDVTAAESGERTLKSELVEFWVNESNLYRTSVRLRASILDANGKELWSGLVGGGSDNFGRSLKPDNYTEGLSNAIQDVAARLVSAPGFRQAIGKS